MAATLDDVAKQIKKARREYGRAINRVLTPIAKNMRDSARRFQAERFRNPTGYTASHTFGDVRKQSIRFKVASRGGFFQERDTHVMRDAYEAWADVIPGSVDEVVMPALLGPGGGRG